MEKTDWFPEDTDPVHEGFYERDYGEQSLLDFWTGSEWRYGAGAGSTYAFYTAYDRLPWRGLKREAPVAA